MKCYWDEWNREHVTRHGISREAAEYVLVHAAAPYPQELGGGKYLVRGQTSDGRYVQVIFVYRSFEELKFEEMSIDELVHFEVEMGPFPYPIHARPLDESERRQHRRRTTR